MAVTLNAWDRRRIAERMRFRRFSGEAKASAIKRARATTRAIAFFIRSINPQGNKEQHSMLQRNET